MYGDHSCPCNSQHASFPIAAVGDAPDGGGFGREGGGGEF